MEIIGSGKREMLTCQMEVTSCGLPPFGRIWIHISKQVTSSKDAPHSIPRQIDMDSPQLEEVAQ